MNSAITVAELAHSHPSSEHGSARFQLIDVRSPTEFRAEHIPGAVNIPMNEIEARLADLEPSRGVILICQGGVRARVCATRLASRRKDVSVLEGGTHAWKEAGLPLVTTTFIRWSLERQVRLIAGLLVLVGVLLAEIVNPWWLALSGFVGFGLTFAGLTDFCPMGLALARMPWNAARQCAAPGQQNEKVTCC